jgi:Protein of unknown function (DUF2752).
MEFKKNTGLNLKDFLFKTRKGNLIICLIILFSNVFLFIVIKFLKFNITEMVPRCAFKQFTGINCLTCGGTRSIQSLFRGDFIRAFKYNPLLIIFLILLIIGYLYFLLNAIRKNFKPIKIDIGNKFIAIFITTIILFVVIRNFDFYKQIFY